MTVEMLSPVPDMAGAALALLRQVQAMPRPLTHLCYKVSLGHFSIEPFFASVRGAFRSYFKSRDLDFEICGIGMCDRLNGHALTTLKEKAPTLLDGQCYIGGTRFDVNSEIAPEWQSFGRELFILPLLLVQKSAKGITMMLNFRADGCFPYELWRDQALSALEALSRPQLFSPPPLFFSYYDEIPTKDTYALTINKALELFARGDEGRKVVLGRRNSLYFSLEQDPMALFSPLVKKMEKSFLFYLDNGLDTSFFGASPELLYRRLGRDFATESLAGTRARGANKEEDEQLKNELFNSVKDQCEHAAVCEHIEALLHDFGARDLITSKLEVMTLSYAQHLLKRYVGAIDAGLSDDKILGTLHPTPAVSGTKRSWALQFIREHEGFDRGFYAGPIGYVHKDGAEFAVAIRSALYHEKMLHIYAASGIVPGSIPEQEWEELFNKQKKIMSVFE